MSFQQPPNRNKPAQTRGHARCIQHKQRQRRCDAVLLAAVAASSTTIGNTDMPHLCTGAPACVAMATAAGPCFIIPAHAHAHSTAAVDSTGQEATATAAHSPWPPSPSTNYRMASKVSTGWLTPLPLLPPPSPSMPSLPGPAVLLLDPRSDPSLQHCWSLGQCLSLTTLGGAHRLMDVGYQYAQRLHAEGVLGMLPPLRKSGLMRVAMTALTTTRATIT